MNLDKFSELMNEYNVEQRKKPGSAWSKDSRDWAVSNGLITGGSDDAMMWRSNLSREEFVAVLQRFAKMIGKA